MSACIWHPEMMHCIRDVRWEFPWFFLFVCFFHKSLTSTHTKCSLKAWKPDLIHSCFPFHLFLAPHPSSCLSSFMLCTQSVPFWLPRILQSLLIALVTQVCVWSSSSNCSGLAWGEEECGRLASRSAPRLQDYIHASMFDEMDSIRSFIRGKVCHWTCTTVLIGFARLETAHSTYRICMFFVVLGFFGCSTVNCELKKSLYNTVITFKL